ncbi:hypothetical protein J2S07_001395 [Robertmurraya andreesenii]|uniref:Uncharacterized protein n=1 Tax=Anoxybacillus andreesenii TaxID=1325932 RepID=A0ABT9V2B5_9BACL|nr:hypothetical protein [Robertmurraya andreesenii]
MITISKAFESFRKDVNEENSVTLAIFEKITSILFKGVCILGVPLLAYMLFFV